MMESRAPPPPSGGIRNPRTWPLTISVFFGVILVSQVFSVLTDLEPRTFDYVFATIVVSIALGISLFASRVLWWIFSVFAVVAIGSNVIGKLLQSWQIIWGWDWQSWINVVLQTAATALLVSPPMVKWVTPLGRSLSLKVQLALIALVLAPIGAYLASNPI